MFITYFGSVFSFLFVGVATLLCGAILGLPAGLRHRSFGVLFSALYCFLVGILTYIAFDWSHILDPGWMITQIILANTILSAVMFLRRYKLTFTIQTIISIWAAAILGLLVGSGYFIYAGIFMIAYLLIAPYLLPAVSKRGRMQLYTMTLELAGLRAFDKVEKIIRDFNLEIQDQKLQRSGELFLTLTYNATAISQHLFMKRLLEIEDVSDVHVL